ncbi:MAG TPA: DUF4397 domain-containing protein [Bacteroidota bacterium]
MKHSAMLKFAVMMFAVLALYLGGCVDVNNPDVQAVDYRASLKFVNFANMGNPMVVTIDKAATTAASVTYQNASTYLNLPAGTRFFSFAYGTTVDTLRKALTPNYKYTMFGVNDLSLPGDTVRTYILSSERASAAPAFVAGSQIVRFYNLSMDTAATVSGGLTFHLLTATSDTSNDTPLVFPGVSKYYYPAKTAQSPQFMIVGAAGDTLVQPTTVGSGDGRFGVVFTGSQTASSWSAKVFKED